ncbi:MAG: hypothetical protein AAF212_01110 [Verrucomicrobiota bacterium]
MSSSFFRALRETRIPFSEMEGRSGTSKRADSQLDADISRILVIGGHPRQIQDISSIARSLSGGAEVESTTSVMAAQERLVRGTRFDWAIAAIRPFDPGYVSTLCRLHMRVMNQTQVQWMALWPGLRPLRSELDAWDVHLSYPASVGQIRRALLCDQVAIS